MTDRQYRVWSEWLKLEWNKPSRTDHYIMQATLANAVKGTKLSDLKIPFGDVDQETVKDVKVAANYAQQHWFSMMSIKPKGLMKE